MNAGGIEVNQFGQIILILEGKFADDPLAMKSFLNFFKATVI